MSVTSGSRPADRRRAPPAASGGPAAPTARRVADGSADAARQARVQCARCRSEPLALSPPGAAGRRAPGGPPRGSGPLRWRTGAGRRAVGGRPWRPRGEAETRDDGPEGAELDPADHHAAADPAEAVLAELTDALAQLRRGRFDVRLPRREGAAGALADQFNDMAAVAQRHNRDLLRIGRSVGREGRMGDRLDEESYDGSWGDGARAVNALIDDLAAPTAEIARVIEAVAEGDLSQHMALEIEGRPLRGEYRRIGRTVNTMVDQLSSFADEVTRVAREVGTDGRLGRPGRRARRRGHVAGAHRLGEHDGVQPHQPGAVDLRRGHRDRAGRPVAHDHRERAGARSPSSPTRSTRSPPRCASSPTRSPAWPARSARRACSAARPRCPGSRAPGRTSPTR